MVLAGKPPIGFFDVVGRGCTRKTKDVVEIAWSRGHDLER